MKARGSRRPRLSPAEKREITRLYGDTSTSTSEICVRLGIGESSLYRVVQLQGLPLRGRTASSTSPGTTPPARAPYKLSVGGTCANISMTGWNFATSGRVVQLDEFGNSLSADSVVGLCD